MLEVRKRIAVFMAQPDSPYQAELLKGINCEAFRLNYDVVLISMVTKDMTVKEFGIGEKQIYSLTNPMLFDAIIIVPDVIAMEGALEYIEENIIKDFDGPVVYVNSLDRPDKLCVKEYSDENFDQMVEHLYSVHGCRNYALMLGPEGHDHTNYRYASIKKAFEKRNISFSEDDVYYGDFWYFKGEEVADAIIKKGKLPDAVMCLCDAMALSLIRAFEKRGIFVPQDVIVTGYDTSGSGSDELYRVTSIRLNNVTLGEDAVRRVAGLELREGASRGGELVTYKSCGCKTSTPKDFVHIDPLPQSAYDECDSFYSGFNFMNETLISAVDLQDLLWKINYYTWYLNDCSNVAICLNDMFYKIMQGEEIEDDQTGYSDKIYLAIDCHAEKKVDMERFFFKKAMYPKMLEPANAPRFFFFVPMHFNQYTYGYMVIENDNPERIFSRNYSQWIRSCTIALESLKQRHHLKLLNRKFEDSTVKDQSTGLYSRNGFNIYAPEMLENAINSRVNFVFLMGDLNCLKYINDTYGHIQGDKAIYTAAQAFAIDFKGSAVYEQRNFRIGGDEFVKIVLGNITEDEINEHIKRIGAYIDNFNATSGLPYPVYLSLGYEFLKPTSKDTIDPIMMVADKRLFENKAKLKRETGFDFKREST